MNPPTRIGWGGFIVERLGSQRGRMVTGGGSVARHAEIQGRTATNGRGGRMIPDSGSPKGGLPAEDQPSRSPERADVAQELSPPPRGIVC